MSEEREPAGKGPVTGTEPAVALLVASAEAAGIRLRVEAGELVVRGPRSATAHGEAVIARKAEVLDYLTHPVVHWDAAAAVRRMEVADTVVEANGCRGSDPAMQAAVAKVSMAYRGRDLAGVIAGCEEVEAAARQGIKAA